MSNGWIKLHRCLLDKAIWTTSTPEQKVTLITVLCLANHEENQWHWKGNKFTCKPGQFITSLPSLALQTGCSVQNIRTSLKKFKEYEFLTDESTKTGRLITLVNWEKYQAKAEQLTDMLTDSQQTANRQLTPNKKDKNNKNDKNVISLEIEQFRSRYSPGQIENIDRYFEILRTTRVSGKLADSTIAGIYKNMNRFDPLVVDYACKTIIKKPDLHSKKENYFVGILRNTTIDEAVKGTQGAQRASPGRSESKIDAVSKFFGLEDGEGG